MSKNSSSRAAPARKGGSLLAGILVGMVLGLILAGAVAWYILKRPNPFVSHVPHEEVHLTPEPVKPAPAPVKPAPAPAPVAAEASAVASASAVGDDKPRFEFYHVLTDKTDAMEAAPVAAPPAPKPAAAAREKEFYLQAGAFANGNDADKLKAKLAMMGMEASVQPITLPDRTVWHRVRLGPYKNANEMNRAAAELKQNGVTATPMRTQ